MICDIWNVAHDTWHRSRDSVSLYTGFLHSEMFRVIRGQNQRPNQNIKKILLWCDKIHRHSKTCFNSVCSFTIYLDQDYGRSWSIQWSNAHPDWAVPWFQTVNYHMFPNFWGDYNAWSISKENQFYWPKKHNYIRIQKSNQTFSSSKVYK